MEMLVEMLVGMLNDAPLKGKLNSEGWLLLDNVPITLRHVEDGVVVMSAVGRFSGEEEKECEYFAQVAREATGRILKEDVVLTWDERDEVLSVWCRFEDGLDRDGVEKRMDAFWRARMVWANRIAQLKECLSRGSYEPMVIGRWMP